MNKRRLLSLALPALAFGCSGDPGVNAPPDRTVSTAQVSKMTPAQRAGYDQAMMSKNQAYAATHGKGPLAPGANGQ